MFPGMKIEVPPLCTVQGMCIYNIFKAENQETKFPLLFTKLSIDKHEVIIFQRLVVLGAIYRPSVPSIYY